MRKTLLFIFYALIVFASSCGTPAESASATAAYTAPVKEPLSISVECPGGYPQVLSEALTKGAEYIKASSGGQLAVSLSDSARDLSGARALNGLISGGSSILVLDAMDAADTVKELSVISIPMLFSGQQQCNSMLKQNFTSLMQQYFNNAGLELIGTHCTSMRNLTSSKPITASADLKSIRMRIENSDYDQLFWKTAGCFPTYLESYNVYIALKQKMLEAQECTNEKIDEYKFNDVQQYLLTTSHLPDIKLIVMNKVAFDALSSEESGWVQAFAAQASQYAVEAQTEKDAQLELKFKNSGMNIWKPTDEIMTMLKACSQPVIDLVKTKIAPEFVDSYIAACKQYEAQASQGA